MKDDWIRLRQLWEEFRAHRCEGSLLQFINDHDDSSQMCGHAFPFIHRICDVILNGRPFRVLRCIECGERLFFIPIGSALQDAGVPYSLSGSDLRQWADDEDRSPAKGPTNWSRYGVTEIAEPPEDDRKQS